MDLGLVVCRYGDCLKITNGSCVPGDGGSHHECLFRLVVFRPFVEEVCVGKIVKSSPDGIQVSIGFYEDIFIPAYWMLRPSQYEETSGLWVWTPKFDDDEEEDEENDKKVKAAQKSNTGASSSPSIPQRNGVAIKNEDTGWRIPPPAATTTTTEENGSSSCLLYTSPSPRD